MKNVRVVIKEGGSVNVEWNGYKGNACFLEAEELYKSLKAQGVDVDIVKVIPNIDGAKKQKIAVATTQKEMSRW